MLNKKLLLFCVSIFQAAVFADYQAVCIVPVANLFDPALKHQLEDPSEQTILDTYHNHPITALNNKNNLRVHQLIFNEQVTVLQETEHEALIALDSAFYCKGFFKQKVNQYWTFKQYLKPLSEIQNPDLIPEPLSYKNKHSCNQEPGTIFTLTRPTKNQNNEMLYSARTRFKIVDIKDNKVHVAAYNPKTNQIEIISFQKDCGIINQNLTAQEKIAGMVKLVLEWSTGNTVAPCARGGASLTHYVTPKRYIKGTQNYPQDKSIGIYYRPETEPVYAGFDMPGMVLSACQIMHIPYFFKNSTTLLLHGKKLDAKHDSIELGDLLVSYGYVGIITDIKNNLITEVRGYQYHHGAARTVSLYQTFQDVETYNDIMEFYKQKRGITFLDKKAFPFLTNQFTLIKMSSIFN